MLDTGIVAARFLQFVAASLLFGVGSFCLYGLRADAPAPLWPKTTISWAAILALFSTMAWFILTMMSITDENFTATLVDFPALLAGTSFGHVVLVRLLAALAVLQPIATFATPRLQTVFAALYTASLAWTGHAVSDDGWPGVVHLGGDVVHLLTAAAWLGALPALLTLLVRARKSGTAIDKIGRAHV